MFRRLFLSLAVLAVMMFAGSSIAEAGRCYRGGGGYYGGGGYGGGGYYPPAYRSARYYGGPSYYRGPSVYRRSYYGGGYPAYYGGRRGGVSLSFGF